MSFTFKIKMPDGQQMVQNLSANSTILDLKRQLSVLGKIPIDSLNVLIGFPPKLFDLTNNDRLLSEAGLSSGDTLILKEAAIPDSPIENRVNQAIPLPGFSNDAQQLQFNGVLLKHPVPADNSCLFSSVYYALYGTLDNSISYGDTMRKVVADKVSSNKDYYTKAFLGEVSNSEYCSWIQKKDSWGGAIELAIMSRYHEIEIIVLDSVNGILNRFGEDQFYSQRILLLFDGIHYDPVYLEIEGQAKQTVFPVENEDILRDAQVLVSQVQSSRQYTDVEKFVVKCLDCSIHLKGQLEATQHAKSTGHQNFGQI